MIDVALKFLRDELNTSFKDAGSNGGEPDVVAFVPGDKIGDTVGFTLGQVSLLLVKIEEDNTLRSADPYAAVAPDGTRQRVNPEIRLNLAVLFVAHFVDYALSLRWLSQVVSFFQNHRTFTPANSPALSPAIDQLTLQLMTLPFAELNEIWNALRTSYRPSVLYRVRMVIFRDAAAEAVPLLNEVRLDLPA